MKNISGSSLVDYVVPTAVVGLVLGLGIYYMVSDGNLLNYFKASVSGYKKNKQIVIDSQGTANIKGGSLGGTADNPKMQCGFKVCTIDFGDFILTGIPEDIAEISTASRGGEQTANYANLITKLAEQMERDGAETGLVNYLKSLATNAKKMGVVEKRGNAAADTLLKVEKSFVDNAADPAKNCEAQLSSIDPNNLKGGDFNTLLSASRYMLDKSVISDQDLKNFAKVSLSIKQDYPNLADWQKDFLNVMTNQGQAAPTLGGISGIGGGGPMSGLDPDQFKKLASNLQDLLNGNTNIQNHIDAAVESDLDSGGNDYEQHIDEIKLTTLTTGRFGNQNLYQVTTKNIDKVVNLVQQGAVQAADASPLDGSKPGARFADMLARPDKYTKATIPDSLKNILNVIGGEITTIGNKIQKETVDLGDGITSVKFSKINEDDIDTKIAETILKKYEETPK